MSRTVFTQTGFALLPCSLLLTVVLLALSASLRSARQQLAVTPADADLQRARLSAESSLTEGEHHLRSRFKAVSADSDLSPTTDPLALSCSQPYSEQSGYQLDWVRSEDRTGVCRITASRAGRTAGTHIRLQAEFALSACQTYRPSAEPAPSTDSATATAERHEDSPVSCRREVRLLSWRTVHEG